MEKHQRVGIFQRFNAAATTITKFVHEKKRRRVTKEVTKKTKKYIVDVREFKEDEKEEEKHQA